MSYLGQKILYRVLNARPAFLAERIFAPWPDLEDKLRSHRMPLLSLENKIPLRDFDILGFSLLYELNYSNILTILDLGGIPFCSKERGEGYPLILAGGPAAFNPEPVSDIFDAFFLGDGEEGFPEIVEAYLSLRRDGAGKEEILTALARIRGVYVPGMYTCFRPSDSPLLARRPKRGSPEQIQKRVLVPLGRVSFPNHPVVPDIQVIFDRVAVEAARGCPQRCRFCQATQVYFPFRVVNPSRLRQSICASLRSTGYEDVSLSALSVSDYPYLEETVAALMEELAGQKVSLSLSSLRPQGLTSAVAESILRVRKTGFTLVPETGTDRLRSVINKNLKNEDILDAAAHAFGRGWQLLKLYFMVGLPTETQEDLEEIVRLTAEIFRLGKGLLKTPPRINLSLSSFIPKPHTPFQWLAMEKEEILAEKQRLIRSRLGRFRSIRLKEHPVRTSGLEGVFSRGDLRLGPVLVQAWKNGARFDSWKDHFDFPSWRRAFETAQVSPEAYLGPLNTEAVLPWDHIGTGLKKTFLLLELKKALRAEPTPSCLESSCARCQGCLVEFRPAKKFSRGPRVQTRPPSFFGQRTEKTLRYELVYSKTGRARFLSHLDLANHLRRVLRRAGVRPSFSEGYHPKMLVSYGPALPLGTEGKSECLEFKSAYRFDGPQLVRRLNRYAGSGIRFLSLRNLSEQEPSLMERIQEMIYSVDLRNPDIRQALGTRKKERNATKKSDREFLSGEISGLARQNPDVRMNLWVDENSTLWLALLPSSRRGWRPQDIVERIIGVAHPAFYLVRERLVFREGRRNITPARCAAGN
jgi:radical SAM family uncharacterized protein/radical SAM-linked protein